MNDREAKFQLKSNLSKWAPPEIMKVKEYPSRYDVWNAAFREGVISGDWVEFGVRGGRSFEVMVRKRPSNTNVFGFDSWRGLPEPWLTKKVGWGRTKRPTRWDDDPSVTLVEGLFQDTVPAWASGRSDPLAVVHIDSDLYSSAKIVLESIDHLIVPGTILIFDEIYNIQDWEQHEWKAFCEWRVNRRVIPIARCARYVVAFRCQ